MVRTSPDKHHLRTELRRRLRAIDDASIHARSVAAAERLAATSEFRRAAAIMIFMPLRHEIDARPVALRAWQLGKTVTVPLVGFQQKHMIPVMLRSLDEPMDEDRFGVRSPKTGEPFPIEMIDLVIAPGLGFDRHGRRIGRGGGFYDRFLSQPQFSGRCCGLAMEEQVVDEVPVAVGDVSVDMLVTDKQVLRFARRRA